MAKAKKIAAGWWEFMGWEIEQQEDGHWNLTPPGESFPSDATATKREAMALIERMEAEDA